MGEYLRSALNTLSANWSNQDGSIGSNGDLDSELLGTTIELKGQRLRFERVISVGGFGFVFRVKDVQTQEQFALKRLIAGDKEAAADVRNEIQVLNKLQTHAHIMRSYASMQMPNSNVFYILTEFCACGSLSNLSLPITNTKQLNRILYQTANAIAHMHLLGIVHRDIKIENILFDNKGFVKLCDFGSATDQTHAPNDNWTAMQRSMVEDECTRKTTPMYRPPEILDLYLNYRIDKPIDIWAFGCMLFLIKFGQHPFEDSSKLRILNGKYSIPTGIVNANQDVHVALIRSCLQINPEDRVKIEEVIETLENNFVDLIAPCVRPKQISPIPTVSESPAHPIGTPGSAQSVSQAFSGFTKYLKDTSSKVLQSVQQSIALRQDLDMSYLTSRIIAMSYPAEGLESAYRNHTESVKAYLETRKSPYVVINVSGRSYGSAKFGHHIKLINGGFAWKEAFRLASLIEILCICDQLSSWVTEQEKRRLLVFHCTDGKINSAFMIAAFLLYIGMFKDQKTANNFFSVQRIPVSFTTSQRRYLDYITNFNSKNKIDLFDQVPKIVQIRSITMQGIPLFTKNRDGCRPLIELFDGSSETCLFSSANEYEELRSYSRASETKVKWSEINVTLDSNEDICIVISHVRSGLGTLMLQGHKMQTLRICSLQFNLALEKQVESGSQTLRFETIALDGIDSIDRYPREFQIVIELQYSTLDSKCVRPKNQLIGTICDPLLLFENQIEFEECKDTFNCQRPAYLINGALPKMNDKVMRSDELLNSVNSPSDYEETCEHTSESKRQQRIEADLLNLTLNSPTKGSRSSQRQPDNLEEALLSDFGVTSSNNSFDLLNDIMSASASNNMSPGNGGPSIGVRSENGAGTSSVDLLEELFAGPNSTPKPDLLNQRPQQTDSMSSTIGATNSIPVPRNASTPNLLGFDPFDQLPSMATSFKQASNDLLKPQKANVSSASGAGFKTDGAANGPTMPRVSSLNAFGSSTASSSAAIHSSFKPDYNRSYFTDSKGGSNGTGLSSKVPNNAFDDLLKGFTKSPTDWNASQQSNQPKSMAQLRKEEMLRNGSVDPLKMKVNEWKEGKKRNIRALLSTLHQIVWDDCSWIAVGMHQLIGPNDVKKMYRKACLSIHPDKLVGSPNEELAKLLFIELNDAWNEFEKQRN